MSHVWDVYKHPIDIVSLSDSGHITTYTLHAFCTVYGFLEEHSKHYHNHSLSEIKPWTFTPPG